MSLKKCRGKDCNSSKPEETSKKVLNYTKVFFYIVLIIVVILVVIAGFTYIPQVVDRIINAIPEFPEIPEM